MPVRKIAPKGNKKTKKHTHTKQEIVEILQAAKDMGDELAIVKYKVDPATLWRWRCDLAEMLNGNSAGSTRRPGRPRNTFTVSIPKTEKKKKADLLKENKVLRQRLTQMALETAEALAQR